MTYIFPKDAPIPVPSTSKWKRLPDGRVEVTFASLEDMRLAVDIACYIKEKQKTDNPPKSK